MGKRAVMKTPSRAQQKRCCAPAVSNRDAPRKSSKVERTQGSRDIALPARVRAVGVAKRAARPSETKSIPRRKARAKKVVGGLTFLKSSFEARPRE